MDPAPLGRLEEGCRMSPLELLVFATAVQWCAGVVILINVVASRLHQSDVLISGGE